MRKVEKLPAFAEILEEQGIHKIIAAELSLPSENEDVLAVINKIRNTLNEIAFKESQYNGKEKSPTSEHVERVAFLVAKLVKATGENVDLVRLAALLHDLGKLEIPNKIIFQKHKFTITEKTWLYDDRIKHVTLSEEILKNLGLYQIAKIVGQTHEKLDGSGYPRGLQKNEIEYVSQFITIVDTIDSVLMSPAGVKNREQKIIELKGYGIFLDTVIFY